MLKRIDSIRPNGNVAIPPSIDAAADIGRARISDGGIIDPQIAIDEATDREIGKEIIAPSDAIDGIAIGAIDSSAPGPEIIDGEVSDIDSIEFCAIEGLGGAIAGIDRIDAID